MGEQKAQVAEEQQREGQVPEQPEGQMPRAKPQEGEAQEPEEQQQQQKTFTADYVKRLRQEAATHRIKAKELQEQLEEMQQLTAKERQALEQKLADIEAKALEAEAKYAEAMLRSEVYLAAVRKGFADPELAWKLLDPDQVEWDEEKGRPVNVEALLDEALKKWPFLAGAGGQTSAMNTRRQDLMFRRSQLQDPAFFAAHKEEIMQAMREGRIIDDLE